MKSLLAIALLLQGVFSNMLISMVDEKNTWSNRGWVEKPVCCRSSGLKSCDLVNVDPDILGSQVLILPGGFNVSFLNMIDDVGNSYHYGSEEADFIVTYNPSSGGMNARAITSSGSSFVLEFCGAQGHVWKEIDVKKLETDKADFMIAPKMSAAADLNQDDGPADNTTMATYSVKFYYTPSFAKVTPDIEEEIDNMIAEANQGYASSKVPIRVKKLCTAELATVDDEYDGGEMIANFNKMKPTFSDIRGTADAATLLVKKFDVCGIGYFDVVDSGQTFTVIQKDCLTGLNVFGHELGHNMGLHHNQDQVENPNTPHGHGHLIKKGKAAQGYQTIMSYSAPGYELHANYYSNPSIIFPETGTPTGIKGISNNAAVLMRNRMKMAAIGDESAVCASSASTSTSIPLTTRSTTSTTISTSTKRPTTITTSTPATSACTGILRQKTYKRLGWYWCYRFCIGDPDCDYLSYLSTTGDCQLTFFSKTEEKDGGPSSITGSRRCCTKENRSNRFRTSYRTFFVETVGDIWSKNRCSQACLDKPGCEYWTYYRYQGYCSISGFSWEDNSSWYTARSVC
jgi:hypothetical protein